MTDIVLRKIQNECFAPDLDNYISLAYWDKSPRWVRENCPEDWAQIREYLREGILRRRITDKYRRVRLTMIDGETIERSFLSDSSARNWLDDIWGPGCRDVVIFWSSIPPEA